MKPPSIWLETQLGVKHKIISENLKCCYFVLKFNLYNKVFISIKIKKTCLQAFTEKLWTFYGTLFNCKTYFSHVFIVCSYSLHFHTLIKLWQKAPEAKYLIDSKWENLHIAHRTVNIFVYDAQLQQQQQKKLQGFPLHIAESNQYVLVNFPVHHFNSWMNIQWSMQINI